MDWIQRKQLRIIHLDLDSTSDASRRELEKVLQMPNDNKFDLVIATDEKKCNDGSENQRSTLDIASSYRLANDSANGDNSLMIFVRDNIEIVDFIRSNDLFCLKLMIRQNERLNLISSCSQRATCDWTESKERLQTFLKQLRQQQLADKSGEENNRCYTTLIIGQSTAANGSDTHADNDEIWLDGICFKNIINSQQSTNNKTNYATSKEKDFVLLSLNDGDNFQITRL